MDFLLHLLYFILLYFVGYCVGRSKAETGFLEDELESILESFPLNVEISLINGVYYAHEMVLKIFLGQNTDIIDLMNHVTDNNPDKRIVFSEAPEALDSK